ncbi:MAG: hypothetical protein ABI672_12395 [Vicinamibacteria bacterium]
MDLHPKVEVTGDYEYLLREPPEWQRDGSEDCPSKANKCMFGEVTPPLSFLEDFFASFPTIPKLKSCDLDTGPKCEPNRLRTGRVCAYGPWVMEDFHGWWPEIHPAEVTWGRDGDFVVVQQLSDQSGRFRRTDDYLEVRRSDLATRPYLQSEVRAWRPWVDPTTTRRISVAWSRQDTQPPMVSLVAGRGSVRELRKPLASGDDLVVSTDLPTTSIAWPDASAICVHEGRTLGYLDVMLPPPGKDGSSVLKINAPVSIANAADSERPTGVKPARNSVEESTPCGDARIEASLIAVEGAFLPHQQPVDDRLLRAEWGIDAAVHGWRYSESQRALVELRYASEATPEHPCIDELNLELSEGRARLEADWAIKIKQIEPGGPPFTVAEVAGPRQVALALYSRATVRMNAQKEAEVRGLDSSSPRNRLRVQLYFPNWRSLPPPQQLFLPTLSVTVQARFRDSVGRLGAFERAFISRAPLLGPGILERDVWPDTLLGIVIANARRYASGATQALLEAQWRFEILGGELADSKSRRLARELRLTGLRSLEDGDIDQDELRQILDLSADWARSLAP